MQTQKSTPEQMGQPLRSLIGSIFANGSRLMRELRDLEVAAVSKYAFRRRQRYVGAVGRRLPSAHLLDVESFERLQQRMAILEGMARGESAVAEGRVVTHSEAKARMPRWLK